MSVAILATKLYVPLGRAEIVYRPRLISKLNKGLGCKLSLICAPAGFGKTTLLSEWLSHCKQAITWLSLDKEDSDEARFSTYLIAALQTLKPTVGIEALSMLQAPQPPSSKAVLTSLINDLTSLETFILVLDDYHLIDSKAIDDSLGFLLEHAPPQMHLVITTREDPQLPLARLRAKGQLSELRAHDLRFSSDETADFLTQVMNLKLSTEDISALESRTEGWIAGLQLAALSLQGRHENATSFIQSFTGSDRFVLDYLLEEVMNLQSEEVQSFLLKTSILERLSGSLCDTVVNDLNTSGQAMLEHLERVNLFLIPLDNERHWYRYHHLFADLLKQRLEQLNQGQEDSVISVLHQQASQWYEDHDFELDAFYHATKAQDIKRAIRLIEGKGMPLHFRGAAGEIKHWLDTLEKSVLDNYPILWTTYASVTLAPEKATETQGMLLAAEAALKSKKQDEETKDQLGRIAAIRATIAVPRRQVDVIVRESERALSYLHADNLAFRLSTAWKLGFAYQHQGKREQAMKAYAEVVNQGEPAGELIFSKLALLGLANLQEENNELRLAEQTYQRVLKLTEGLPTSIASVETKLGLARIAYEWNDLEGVDKLLTLLASQAKTTLTFTGSFIDYAMIQARFKLTQKDIQGALQILSQAEQFAQEHDLKHGIPKLSELKTLVLLRLGNITAAQDLAQTYKLSQGQARVYLAKGDYPNALALLEPLLQDVSSKNYKDQMLTLLVLMAKSLFAKGNRETALEKLATAFSLAAANGFIRSLIDEGLEMKRLLEAAKGQGIMPDYVDKLLASFESDEKIPTQVGHPLIEPLSERELEILKLIAQGLTNREIGEQLFRALDTIKGHNRNIFGKLQVKNRVEAIARARELGLL